MRFEDIPGEFAFKALFGKGGDWHISEGFFTSLRDAEFTALILDDKLQVKWPVEIHEDGAVYIPAKDELNEIE